jgi:hypothetical protein
MLNCFSFTSAPVRQRKPVQLRRALPHPLGHLQILSLGDFLVDGHGVDLVPPVVLLPGLFISGTDGWR